MRDDKRKDRTLNDCIKHTKRLLYDFCIDYNEDIEKRIKSLYPNQVLIDNYIRDLIREKLRNSDHED